MAEENEVRVEDEQQEEAVEEVAAQSLIDKANAAAERIEAANKATQELVRRNEEAKVRDTLGGQAEAGIIAPPPREDTPEEYADKVMAGEANPLL